MKKSWLLNVALLVAVVALGWFVYQKPPSGPVVHTLSSLSADAASLIRVERRGQIPVVLEKKDGLWLITAPFTAHAEPFQVQRLLAILEAESLNRLAATDLARFDLDPPAVTLTVNEQSFSFGTISTVTHEQYVLTGNAVYAVEMRYGAALPSEATQLMRKQLFAGGEAPVRVDTGEFTVMQSDGRWVATPASQDLNQETIDRWIAGWRHASAIRVSPWNRRKPVGEIRVELENGKKLVLGILQRGPELILLRPDENIQYHFFSEVARRLLSPPGETPVNR
ncbi:MAG: DUF4340 domain-containing protein [Burkholderiales bacterium]|nr:DUF4340 domain-containing protein [Burkholderiales bacterium]